MTRIDRRNADQLRRFKITKYFQKYPAGSVLIETGNTKVICAATIQDGVPSFLRGSGTGWLNAEYSLLPSATLTRSPREASRGRQNGRTQEIQRLIGRCLRSVMDFKALGERTIIIDCDVIQADGGTRTASITGAFVALAEALATIYDPKKPFPLKDFTASSTMKTMSTRPSTALFFWKKRMSASFQKLWAAKLVSTAISASLCLSSKSAAVKVSFGEAASPTRIAFAAI